MSLSFVEQELSSDPPSVDSSATDSNPDSMESDAPDYDHEIADFRRQRRSKGHESMLDLQSHMNEFTHMLIVDAFIVWVVFLFLGGWYAYPKCRRLILTSKHSAA